MIFPSEVVLIEKCIKILGLSVYFLFRLFFNLLYKNSSYLLCSKETVVIGLLKLRFKLVPWLLGSICGAWLCFSKESLFETGNKEPIRVKSLLLFCRSKITYSAPFDAMCDSKRSLFTQLQKFLGFA